MKDWQQRVIDESAGVEYKLGKLQDFMESSRFSVVARDERKRLRRQAVLMGLYSEVLKERIANFEQEKKR